jgi:hypothetical protein
MLRLAIGVCLLAAAIWFGGVYKLGDKTLAGHLDEVYTSPVVQQKLQQLHKGFDNKLDDFALERSQQESTKRRIAKRAPMAPVPSPEPVVAAEPVDVRPSKVKKMPPKDSLTEHDRHELEKLLSDKLSE